MYNHITIIKRFDNMDDALNAAKELGNDIYEGYENNIPSAKSVNKRLGVTEYMMTANGTLLFIAKFDGQQVLNEVTLHSSISDGVLHPAILNDDLLSIRDTACVHKSDKRGRKEICANGIILVDQRLVAKFEAAK